MNYVLIIDRSGSRAAHFYATHAEAEAAATEAAAAFVPGHARFYVGPLSEVVTETRTLVRNANVEPGEGDWQLVAQEAGDDD